MFDFLSEKFSSLFSRINSNKSFTEKDVTQTLETVKSALLEADVPFDVVNSFISSLKDEVLGKKIATSLKPAEQLTKIIYEKLTAFLGGKEEKLNFSTSQVIMVMGLQGSGKTTTIAKLAHRICKDAAKENKVVKILVASVDFYRPAAIDQLKLLADKVNISFYRAESTQPVHAAKEIYAYFKDNRYDLLFLDTAGRLHVDNHLLGELQEIDVLIRPSHKILILDAMTGQESLSVAKAFDGAVGFHASILTKMDSDTRGGAAFAFRYVLKKPIIFVGEGEKIDNLNLFYPDRAAEKILGMGDLRSFVEMANEKIAVEEQKKINKAFTSGKFTLQDFADQMGMMNKIGSLSNILKYMPGMNIKISQEMIEKGEQELKKFRAIIFSMTPKERLNIALLNQSRMQRVAKGAGVQVSDIKILLRRFEEAKQYAKLFSRF